MSELLNDPSANRLEDVRLFFAIRWKEEDIHPVRLVDRIGSDIKWITDDK